MTSVGAIAPVGLIEQGHPIEMIVDRLRHLALQNTGNRVPPKPSVALAPFQPVCPHRLYELKCLR
jgi:hypothetical protein